MRYILFILTICLMTSCGHYKWLAKHKDIACDFCDIQKHDTTIVHDTLIVNEPYISSIDSFYTKTDLDILTIDLQWRCDSLNKVIIDSLTKYSKKGSSTTIYSNGGHIYIKTQCKEDSLKMVIKNYIQIIERLKEEKKVITVEKPQKIVEVSVGKFYKWFFYIFVIVLLLTTLFIIYKKFMKNKIETLLNIINDKS